MSDRMPSHAMARPYRNDDADWQAVRDSEEANAFYRSLGFADEYRAHAWHRDLGPA